MVGRIGDRITSYFGDVCTHQVRTIDTTVGSFLLELTMTPLMREKMPNQLTWL